MNSITNTGTQAIDFQPKGAPDKPVKKDPHFNGLIRLQTIQAEPEVFDACQGAGCHGTANEVDMEAFFAAWGSDDATYDVDGNGLVDGGDLTILLSNQSNQPMAGSVDDVLQQWGASGDSTADLNADGIVDGEDLVLALAGPTLEQTEEADPEPSFDTRLENLLADWGTDAARSDLTGDGIVDGLDLSFLLGGGNDTSDTRSAVAANPVTMPGLSLDAAAPTFDPLAALRTESARAGTRDLGARIFDQLQTMGFEKHPPRNLGSLVDAFKLAPTDSRALLSNISELFGADDRGELARG